MKRETDKDLEVLIKTVAYLIDAVSWHLRGTNGTDARSLLAARSIFERHFIGQVRDDDADAV